MQKKLISFIAGKVTQSSIRDCRWGIEKKLMRDLHHLIFGTRVLNIQLTCSSHSKIQIS